MPFDREQPSALVSEERCRVREPAQSGIGIPEWRNFNLRTSEKLSHLGNSGTFYSVLLKVELAKPLP
jgi:hypothetical protein